MADASELLRGYIEPQAVDLRLDHDGQIRLSTAISLKRIADHLGGIRNSLAAKAAADAPYRPDFDGS